MKKTREDNTVTVIQRAVRYLRIPVTKSSVRESLKSHSNYPTFKSICDALDEWNVEHYPLKYQLEEIMDLRAPYIVHFKSGSGQLAFVSEIKNNRVTFYESYNIKQNIGFEEYLEKCSGAVILLNPDERSGDLDYRKKWQEEVISNSVLPVIIIALLFYIILESINAISSDNYLLDNVQGLICLTKITGIALSGFLVLHEYEVRISIIDKLCHLNKSTNCNTVLNDKASKVFGWIGWADIGFIYFMGGLLVLLQGFRAPNYSLLATVSALSLPYPVFSFYYQGFVLKKWCPLCLGVQLLLIAEFIFLLPQFSKLNFSLIGISNFFLTFLIVGIIYILSIMYFREKTSNESNYIKYIGFRKNPDVLRTLLLNQKRYDISVTQTGLVFGDQEALMKVTAFLSLNCSHCARAFEKIKKILKSREIAAFNIILITTDIKIVNTLYQLNSLNKENEALDLLDQWFNADPYSRNKISETVCIPDVNDVSSEVSNENLNLFKACNVNGTPTFFVNGYLLPSQYDIDDIKYFSEIFIRKVVATE